MAYIAIKANMSTLIAYLTVSREIQYFVLSDETYEMVGWVWVVGGAKKPKYKNLKSTLQFLVAFCFLITKI